MQHHIREAQWSQLREFIAGRMGLHFSPERKEDLERGFASAAQEFGFDDASRCVDWLLTAPPTKAQMQVLATHLTIGETYFFRDKQALEALSDYLLPELIRSRRGHQQRLRIWSAACSSGEEAYSLAILLHQALSDLPDWQVTVIATDINARFLRKAATGIYSEWSFRNRPAWFKQRYFNRMADGRYAIIPEIKNMVTFSQLNLVEDDYPSLENNTSAMDVIFCRNVLMYFTPSQTRKVIAKLSQSLVTDGWLAVSPSEASAAMFPQFMHVNFPGAILFQKRDELSRTEPKTATNALVWEAVAPAAEGSLPDTLSTDAVAVLEPTPLQEEPATAEPSWTPLTFAESLYRQGRYEEAADTLLAAYTEHQPEPAAFSLLARALANQGKLADALAWCDHWITADKLDARAYYLRTVILLELGDTVRAKEPLQRAVYLRPDFVLAHFSLGNLARGCGKLDEAKQHFTNALRLLRSYHPDDLLPESDCLTAGRLTKIITSM